MGSDVLGGMLKTYINALSAVNKVDQTELTKVMGNAIEDYFTATTIPVASMMDYAGLTDPTTAWVIANYRTLDQTTYAALFTLIGHRYAKTKSDRDTAETASEFHIPDSLDTYIRSGFSVELDYDEISTSIDLLGITDHGITRDGTPIRFFTQGTLPTVISSLTDSSWTTLYVRVISTNTIELYDTEAHAIDTANTTGRIDFTSSPSPSTL